MILNDSRAKTEKIRFFQGFSRLYKTIENAIIGTHNPEVVGSSPSPATIRKDSLSWDNGSFFVGFHVSNVLGRSRQQSCLFGPFLSAFRRHGGTLSSGSCRRAVGGGVRMGGSPPSAYQFFAVSPILNTFYFIDPKG